MQEEHARLLQLNPAPVADLGLGPEGEIDDSDAGIPEAPQPARQEKKKAPADAR